jgi:hypothetical protein
MWGACVFHIHSATPSLPFLNLIFHESAVFGDFPIEHRRQVEEHVVFTVIVARPDETVVAILKKFNNAASQNPSLRHRTTSMPAWTSCATFDRRSSSLRTLS